MSDYDTDHDISGDLSGTYIKRQDVAHGPLLFEIASVDKVVFEPRNGKPAESKWALTFKAEPLRKFTLNKTNLALIAKAFGRKTGPWLGRTIELTLDESVSFAGQLVGGIRVRVPKPARTSRVLVPRVAECDDSVPPPDDDEFEDGGSDGSN